MTPAEELATAAQTLRKVAPKLRGLHARVAEPAAEWLDHEANLACDAHLWAEREPCGWCGEPAHAHALAVARQINTSA